MRISDTTIRKRLGDFSETPSSQLTIDEFQKIDLEEEQDPPSFTLARRRAKQQLEELNKPEIAAELEAFENAISKALGADSIKNTPINGDESTPVVVSEKLSRTCEIAKDGIALFVPPNCAGSMTDSSWESADTEGITLLLENKEHSTCVWNKCDGIFCLVNK